MATDAELGKAVRICLGAVAQAFGRGSAPTVQATPAPKAKAPSAPKATPAPKAKGATAPTPPTVQAGPPAAPLISF